MEKNSFGYPFNVKKPVPDSFQYYGYLERLWRPQKRELSRMGYLVLVTISFHFERVFLPLERGSFYASLTQ